jgi:hypothetical protein
VRLVVAVTVTGQASPDERPARNRGDPSEVRGFPVH